MMRKTIVLLIITVCAGLSYQFPEVMLNPGELVAGHQEIAKECAACHHPFWGVDNKRCIKCHEPSTIGLDTVNPIDSTQVLFHEGLGSLGCTHCHSDHLGIEPEGLHGFEHALLPSSTRSDCSNCHRPLNDRLHQQLSTDCQSCHTTQGWKKDAKFDHGQLSVNSGNCSSCHSAPKDTFHHLFTETCNSCHSTDQWTPSSFDHSTYFKLDRKHNSKCITCHTANQFNAYTCYGCHEHSENKIKREHYEEGIRNFSDCASCHPSGNEHDAIMNGKSRQESKSKGKKKRKKKHHDDDDD